jgi:hypothetical protein
MAEITYQLNGELPENIPGFEQYQDKDTNLIESFQINNLFDPTKNFSELHILDLGDTLLSSKYYYTGYKLSLNAQSAGKEGASVLTIDPIQDALSSGYSFGGIKLLYHFLNDLYTPDSTTLDFYIDSISPDRTELQLLTNKLTAEDVVSYTESVKTNLKSQSYFSEFRLNFKNNNLLIGVNLDNLETVNGKAVVVKLYEPLPDDFDIKSTLSLVEIISDSVAYEIDYQETLDQPVFPTLRSANFNLDIQDENVIPTQYLNYDDLLSYKVGNTNSEIYSMISEKGVELSIDYSDYSNFIHFSSAQERLLNFKYKLDLLASYSQSLSTKGSATGGSSGVSGSVAYYEGLYQGLINNFDHYERFLYYESGSNSWPKTNNIKPYINQVSSLATTWYNSTLTAAVAYDSTNYNSLAETIPTYLRDDPANDNYLTFVYMVGQHFDNLWVYGDAVTDKYDNDNRLNYGISKDLVGEALKNFGVKLYTSNKSIEDLFSTFIGQAYQSGSEVINHYITGSLTGSNTPIQPTSFDNYQKEIQKRIYHNLPLLLKSKGTERGLRALINCFGIPADVLDIKLYGGRDTYKTPILGDSQYYTSSLDKIRLDNTGSTVNGSTLSNYTSIIKRDDKYTDDIHVIEVGFSPTDAVDNYIIQSGSLLISTGTFTTNFINRVLADGGTVESAQALLDTLIALESIGSPSISADASFNYSIDQFLGDPGNLYLDNYSGLDIWNKYVTQNLSRYNVQDYVRLIKFFDNTVFKMIKDFIPARSIADTGIIIKPSILNISKAKSVVVSGSIPEYSTDIATYSVSSQNASTFKIKEGERSTNYLDYIQTPTGRSFGYQHTHEEPKYNGEFSSSLLSVSKTDLNQGNVYKQIVNSENFYEVVFVNVSNDICNLTTSNLEEPVIVDPTVTYSTSDFFSFTNPNTSYSASLTTSPINYQSINLSNGYQFSSGLDQYQNFLIKADNWDYEGVGGCTATVTARSGICNLRASTFGDFNVEKYSSNTGKTYDLTGVDWFTSYEKQTNLQYTASWLDGTTPMTVGISAPTQYKFEQALNTEVTITVKDTLLGASCQASQIVYVNQCDLGTLPSTDPYGYSFDYSSADWGPIYEFAYLGGPKMQRIIDTANYQTTSQNTNLGIQYFFTPNTQNYVYRSLDLNYSIYKLIYNSSNQTYNVEVVQESMFPPVLQQINNPEDIPHPVCSTTNAFYGTDTGTGYSCLDYSLDLDVNLFGSFPGNGPIALQTPLKNYYKQGIVGRQERPARGTVSGEYTYEYSNVKYQFVVKQYYASNETYLQWILNYGTSNPYPTAISGPTPPLSRGAIADNNTYDYNKLVTLVDSQIVDYAPSELPQAYIIEARSSSYPVCHAEVTVYGEKAVLESIEGRGTNIRFEPPKNSSSQSAGVGGWLLVGFDYSQNTIPSPDYPNIPPGYSKWIFVKIRRFS